MIDRRNWIRAHARPKRLDDTRKFSTLSLTHSVNAYGSRFYLCRKRWFYMFFYVCEKSSSPKWFIRSQRRHKKKENITTKMVILMSCMSSSIFLLERTEATKSEAEKTTLSFILWTLYSDRIEMWLFGTDLTKNPKRTDSFHSTALLNICVYIRRALALALIKQ